ncbi:hypothetical protein FRX31_008833 [Thalictrum thalictroides]|uniref:RNase H type-1 domain-containing protein n=1 Tax=Thalictrum thalictroides TaxID=46969 RepID=A0A7J6WVY0_THATH|nr:hypothetical protein FRX31_008833 [Thalictrum thalictroides]
MISIQMEAKLQEGIELGAIRIRADASFQKISKAGAVVAVVYTQDGSVRCLQCAHKRLKADFAYEAEIQRIDIAVKLTRMLNLTKIVMESDCKLLMEALEEGGQCIDWRNSAIFSDVLAYFSFIVFSWI